MPTYKFHEIERLLQAAADQCGVDLSYAELDQLATCINRSNQHNSLPSLTRDYLYDTLLRKVRKLEDVRASGAYISAITRYLGHINFDAWASAGTESASTTPPGDQEGEAGPASEIGRASCRERV